VKTIVLQDATIESALYVHHHKTHTLLEFLSMNSIIWCKKWLIKNSNEGQLGARFLQGNTNKHIDISRKTTDSYRIEKSYPTLMGHSNPVYS
jgi:hypothetical protein